MLSIMWRHPPESCVVMYNELLVIGIDDFTRQWLCCNNLVNYLLQFGDTYHGVAKGYVDECRNGIADLKERTDATAQMIESFCERHSFLL